MYVKAHKITKFVHRLTRPGLTAMSLARPPKQAQLCCHTPIGHPKVMPVSMANQTQRSSPNASHKGINYDHVAESFTHFADHTIIDYSILTQTHTMIPTWHIDRKL